VLLGAAAVTWYSPSYAQAPDRVRRVAVMSFSASSIEAFRSVVVPELAKLGFVAGRNLAVTTHIGLSERMPEVAREALAAHPDVVVATRDPAILAIKAASSNVPIVMSLPVFTRDVAILSQDWRHQKPRFEVSP